MAKLKPTAAGVSAFSTGGQFSAFKAPPAPPKEILAVEKNQVPAEPSVTPKAEIKGTVRRKKMKTNRFVDKKGQLVAEQTTRSYILEWEVAEGLSDYAATTKQSASLIVNELIKKHILQK